MLVVNCALYFAIFLLLRFIPSSACGERAESAAAKNKFWQMHDHIYEHQRALDDNQIIYIRIHLLIGEKTRLSPI